MSLYADDTAFFKGSNNMMELNRDLTETANQFKDWCDLNRLTLNLNKSKVMVLSGYSHKKTQKMKENVSVSIGKMNLELVISYRYLGLIIDERLTYNEHLKMVKGNIRKRSHLLKKIRWAINERDALLLYKSSIIPYFDIGSLFYSGACRNETDGLQTLQNNCLRTIVGKKKWSNTTIAHERCKILTVKQHRQLTLVKYGHMLSKKTDNLRNREKEFSDPIESFSLKNREFKTINMRNHMWLKPLNTGIISLKI